MFLQPFYFCLVQLLLGHFKGGEDYLIHIIIAILPKAAAEEHLAFLFCQGLLLGGAGGIAIIVYSIIRLFALHPIIGIFFGNDGIFLGIAFGKLP